MSESTIKKVLIESVVSGLSTELHNKSPELEYPNRSKFTKNESAYLWDSIILPDGISDDQKKFICRAIRSSCEIFIEEVIKINENSS